MKEWLYYQYLKNPKKIALADAIGSKTYDQLYTDSEALAVYLRSKGITKGSRVAVFLPTSFLFITLIHALIVVRAIFVPVNLRLHTAEINRQLEIASVRFLITNQEFQKFHQLTISGLQILLDLEYDISTKLVQKSESKDKHDLEPEDIHSILMTSGTTGTPKGALLSYNNIYSSARSSQKRLGLKESDRWLLTIPLYHIGGLSIVTRGCINGTTIVIDSKFDANNLIAIILDLQITVVSLVPTMLRRLMDNNSNLNVPAKLRLILIGGGPVNQRLIMDAKSHNLPIAVTYGLTEATSQVTTALTDTIFAKPLSAGKPIDSIAVRIIDPDENDCQTNEIGEIVIAGSSVIRAYLTGELSKTIEGEFRTGDLGYLDADGDLFVLSRRSDLIVTGGENVYPIEVERALSQHSLVSEICVVGIPDDEWGQIVVAAIVPQGSHTVNYTDLRNFLREKIARFKVPKKFIVFDDLPKLGLGKYDRKKISTMVKNKVET
ncbi:MAG: o-succinylbenzoate--CoA ligase [Candidatus Heimdallarchaeota archaeon]|nr:o-succinylbenzoate--CoA ligase [Candidatus Heimdallarchaeota archaeon]